MFSRRLKTLLGLLAGLTALQGQPLASPSLMWPEHIIDCGMETKAHPLTVYVSETPRIYAQRLFLKPSGTFTVIASAQDFTFEGHAYVRNNLRRKWELVAKSPPGQKTWSRIWRITNLEGVSEIQMRMIKDDNGCKDCVINMNVSSVCL